MDAARRTCRADSLPVGEVALRAESAEGRGETGDAFVDGAGMGAERIVDG